MADKPKKPKEYTEKDRQRFADFMRSRLLKYFGNQDRIKRVAGAVASAYDVASVEGRVCGNEKETFYRLMENSFNNTQIGSEDYFLQNQLRNALTIRGMPLSYEQGRIIYELSRGKYGGLEGKQTVQTTFDYNSSTRPEGCFPEMSKQSVEDYLREEDKLVCD